MVRLSSRFDGEKRPWFYDVNVSAEQLGIEDTREREWRKPYPLPLLRNAAPDEEIRALVGFDPRRENWRRPGRSPWGSAWPFSSRTP